MRIKVSVLYLVTVVHAGPYFWMTVWCSAFVGALVVFAFSSTMQGDMVSRAFQHRFIAIQIVL